MHHRFNHQMESRHSDLRTLVPSFQIPDYPGRAYARPPRAISFSWVVRVGVCVRAQIRDWNVSDCPPESFSEGGLPVASFYIGLPLRSSQCTSRILIVSRDQGPGTVGPPPLTHMGCEQGRTDRVMNERCYGHQRTQLPNTSGRKYNDYVSSRRLAGIQAATGGSSKGVSYHNEFGRSGSCISHHRRRCRKTQTTALMFGLLAFWG
jgi:hypothetical protein